MLQSSIFMLCPLVTTLIFGKDIEVIKVFFYIQGVDTNLGHVTDGSATGLRDFEINERFQNFKQDFRYSR